MLVVSLAVRGVLLIVLGYCAIDRRWSTLFDRARLRPRSADAVLGAALSRTGWPDR